MFIGAGIIALLGALAMVRSRRFADRQRQDEPSTWAERLARYAGQEMELGFLTGQVTTVGPCVAARDSQAEARSA